MDQKNFFILPNMDQKIHAKTYKPKYKLAKDTHIAIQDQCLSLLLEIDLIAIDWCFPLHWALLYLISIKTPPTLSLEFDLSAFEACIDLNMPGLHRCNIIVYIIV